MQLTDKHVVVGERQRLVDRAVHANGLGRVASDEVEHEIVEAAERRLATAARADVRATLFLQK